MEKGTLLELCNNTLKKLKHDLNLQKCTLYLLDDNRQKLSIFTSVDLTKTQMGMGQYKLGEGATGLAGESREPVVIENVYNNIVFLNKAGSRNHDCISYIAVPMVIEDELVGVLGVHLNRDSGLSFDETIEVLTIVSSLLAHNIVIHKEIEIEKKTLKNQNEYYKREILQEYNFENIIGTSENIQKVFDIIKKVSKSKATVLIRGESGTGKELIASAIHNLSDRKDGPFIKLNCAAITETLLESELFGHEKGAFTDAKATRSGRFELADGGTLFLDEIGDVSANLQVKLLRVLQEQEFERVGGAKTIKVNVRLIAATNRNLEDMISKNQFREDLFYRLNVIPLFLPPLRDRAEDLDLLVCSFLEKFSKLHKKELVFTKEALLLMHNYNWPGNIRELENTIERIVLMSESKIVDDELICTFLPYLNRVEKSVESKRIEPINSDKILTQDDIFELERESIVKALKQCGGVQKDAAKILGLTARQLGYKIQKYEI
jgi:Nif-specific regulatory protein